MSHLRFWTAWLVMLVLSGALTRAQAPTPNAWEVPDVSIVSLIAVPERFDGKYIRVAGVGYFDTQAHVCAICLTREDRDKANSANAIFLDLNSSIENAQRFNNKFVVVQGTFDDKERGHLGGFAATLRNVDKVEEVSFNVR